MALFGSVAQNFLTVAVLAGVGWIVYTKIRPGPTTDKLSHLLKFGKNKSISSEGGRGDWIAKRGKGL